MRPTDIITAVRRLAQGKEPEFDITLILKKHRCHYLLQQCQKQEPAEDAWNRIAIRERLRACQGIFSQSQFPYAVVKGAVLSQMIYGDPLARHSGDIDILIRREDADLLKDLLTACGFVQGRVTKEGITPFTRREILFQTAMSHQAAPYIKETGNPLCPYVNVDVNLNLMWGESNEKLDTGAVLAYTTPYRLFDFTLRKLTPEMEFVALCLHHYKDLHSLYLLAGGSLHLGLYCDIYLYLKHVQPQPNILQALCRQFPVGQYLYVCVHDTNQIFDDAITSSYLSLFEEWKNTDLINSFGLSDTERKPWNMTLPERLFHPNLALHIFSQLNEREKEKIRINQTLMQ